MTSPAADLYRRMVGEGRWVRVTGPTGRTWEGEVVAVADFPTVVLRGVLGDQAHVAAHFPHEEIPAPQTPAVAAESFGFVKDRPTGRHLIYTPAEHYREATLLLLEGNGCEQGCLHDDCAGKAATLARARVHAILATAPAEVAEAAEAMESVRDVVPLGPPSSRGGDQ